MVKDISKLNSDLKNLIKVGDKVITAKFFEAGELIRGEAVRSIQNKEHGHNVTRYTASGNSYDHVSAPEGSAPNTDRGSLVKSIRTKIRGDDVVVGSFEDAPHGLWLEVGNERGQKWPWLKPAFNKMQPKIKRKIGEIGAAMFKKAMK